ncbi:hypothetical protein E3T39_01895 [Cryobacterium suzukii]|uniref:Uncharacterized protein n=1 Tax=Cryobacterium suzukii TaxID=1259198 RepID=A0A4R9AIU4_9MICO|nr:hypothetical protein E3T39_01895 [Cryobacterium suzukii]
MVVLGAVAAVIGLVLLLVPSGQASFGWFAYAPLSNTTFFPPFVQLSPHSQIGSARSWECGHLTFAAASPQGERLSDMSKRHGASGMVQSGAMSSASRMRKYRLRLRIS